MRSSAFDVVTIVASTGGLAALRTIMATLPGDFPLPVVAFQHRSEHANDVLPRLLTAGGPLTARPVTAGSRLTPGIWVLPPGWTGQFVEPKRLQPEHAPRGKGADVLLRSMSAMFAARCLAVVLTGRLDDGASGVREVKRRGGRVFVQDPTTAAASGMPNAAIATGCVDHILALRLISSALVAYAMAPGAADYLTVPVPSWARLGPPHSVPA
jgi:two-component system chemotaxis response regulator CheB